MSDEVVRAPSQTPADGDDSSIWKLYAKYMGISVGGLLAIGAIIGVMGGVEIGIAEALKSRLGAFAIVPGFFGAMVVKGILLGAFFAHQKQRQSSAPGTAREPEKATQ